MPTKKMISYTQIYKALVLIVLAMNSNQVRVYLEVNPAAIPLGYSIPQAGAYAVFLGLFMTSFLLALLDAGKLTIIALSGCLLVVLSYPISLLYYAILAGLSSLIPLFLVFFLLLSVLALVMGFYQLKREHVWLTTSHIKKRDYVVCSYLLLSLPTIWVSGLSGDHTAAFLNYYATFLYVAFALMLLSIWRPKALRILPHLIFLWSILFASLIVYFGYWQTGYWLTIAFHTLYSIAYLYVLSKSRQLAPAS